MGLNLQEIINSKEFARELARVSHDDMGQRRRGSGNPYWYHTQTVADIVKAYGGSDEQIIAAELHDTIEDIDNFPLELLEDNFSIKVRNIILELTNDEKKSKVNKEAYMNEKLVNLSDSALLVKLADMYSNFTDGPRPKQRERMINNINYLIENREKFTKKCRELLDSILMFIGSTNHV